MHFNGTTARDFIMWGSRLWEFINNKIVQKVLASLILVFPIIICYECSSELTQVLFWAFWKEGTAKSMRAFHIWS